MTKYFGGRPVVDGVSFAVGAGEFVSLVGRNGAGKSTLLRILGTTLIADGGRAIVAGHDVAREGRAVRRLVGFCLTEERSFYLPLSGRRNLAFFGGVAGLRPSARRARSQELIEALHLEDVADRPFATYSSGQRLRLSLARALLCRPRVLLLDEATRSLDAETAREFKTMLLQVARDNGCAVLEATHDLREAARSDRVLVIQAGQLVADLHDPGEDGIESALFGTPE